VVESEAVPAGTAILADWRYAILWDREQGAILVSDSHADFFIKNLIAILAELRAAFGIVRPAAFVKIALS
jgi:HK97 family phage major capsid protein